MYAAMKTDADQFVPRRGRPSLKQAQAIDRVIIETARRKFLDEGFDNVAMEHVALSAGVSKGTLYARYGSKDDLFDAVVGAAIADWSVEAAQQDHLLTDDVAQRLLHHALIIVGSLQKPDVMAFQRMMLAQRERFPRLTKAMLEQGFRFIVRIIADELERAAARDGQSCRDAQGAATMFVSAITGLEMQDPDLTSGDGGRYEDYARRCVELLLAARAAW